MPGGDAVFQFRKELVLLVDGQGQQPVQEARHGRQLLLERALPCELQSGGFLEPLQRPAGDVAAPERQVEPPQGRLGIEALEVVALPEERRIAPAHCGLRVALSACDGAQAVQPSRDRGDEPPLALHVRGHRAEQRSGRLVRPMGPAQPLDRLVGAPARLQQVVDPALGVWAREVCVVAPPGAPGHREHQDALGPLHERRRLGEVGGGRPAAERQAFAPASVILSTRRERPVTSATASCPKCWTTWSRAEGTGGREASFSSSASRCASASWHRTGWPSASRPGGS